MRRVSVGLLKKPAKNLNGNESMSGSKVVGSIVPEAGNVDLEKMVA